MKTSARLIAAALRTYPFRLPRPDEAAEHYLAAVIAHVESFDWAAAQELRVGKRQADWTPAEVDAFAVRMQARGDRPRRDPTEFAGTGPHAFVMARDLGPYPVEQATLFGLAERGLRVFAERRTRDPRGSLPIMASVLLTDGQLHTGSPGRDDRIPFLKMLAQNLPVFGFVIVFDAFMHVIDTGPGRSQATKRDCLMAHIGTREIRLLKRRPYDVDDQGRVVFEQPPPADYDLRSKDWIDPYIGVFVSVPTPSGDPS